MCLRLLVASSFACSLAALLVLEPSARADAFDYSDESLAPDAPVPDRPAPPPLHFDGAKENASIGMSLHRFQDDFGLGGTFTTPAIAHWVRFTIGGGVAWYPYGRTAEGAQTWDPFYHARVVAEIGPGYLKGIPVRPYGFAGTQLLLLPSTLSDTHFAVGGLGGFGMELAFASPGGVFGPVTYYMELGGIGTGATASKLASSPSIASGFLIDAGFRVYL